MTNQERNEKEMDRNLSLLAQNVINQDNSLLQVSGGLMVVLATFGKDIMKVNKTLSYLTVIFLGLTILQVLFGYFISSQFFTKVIGKLNTNHVNGLDLADGLGNLVEGKINSVLNTSQFITFAIGILFFVVLLFIYIGRIQ